MLQSRKAEYMKAEAYHSKPISGCCTCDNVSGCVLQLGAVALCALGVKTTARVHAAWSDFALVIAGMGQVAM